MANEDYRHGCFTCEGIEERCRLSAWVRRQLAYGVPQVLFSRGHALRPNDSHDAQEGAKSPQDGGHGPRI
jgi:hypothetical protein